jgi:hypothetical protein
MISVIFGLKIDACDWAILNINWPCKLFEILIGYWQSLQIKPLGQAKSSIVSKIEMV